MALRNYMYSKHKNLDPNIALIAGGDTVSEADGNSSSSSSNGNHGSINSSMDNCNDGSNSGNHCSGNSFAQDGNTTNQTLSDSTKHTDNSNNLDSNSRSNSYV